MTQPRTSNIIPPLPDTRDYDTPLRIRNRNRLKMHASLITTPQNLSISPECTDDLTRENTDPRETPVTYPRRSRKGFTLSDITRLTSNRKHIRNNFRPLDYSHLTIPPKRLLQDDAPTSPLHDLSNDIDEDTEDEYTEEELLNQSILVISKMRDAMYAKVEQELEKQLEILPVLLSPTVTTNSVHEAPRIQECQEHGWQNDGFEECHLDSSVSIENHVTVDTIEYDEHTNQESFETFQEYETDTHGTMDYDSRGSYRNAIEKHVPEPTVSDEMPIPIRSKTRHVPNASFKKQPKLDYTLQSLEGSILALTLEEKNGKLAPVRRSSRIMKSLSPKPLTPGMNIRSSNHIFPLS